MGSLEKMQERLRDAVAFGYMPAATREVLDDAFGFIATQAAALAKVTAALDDTQATLSAIRASLTGDAATRDLQHIFNLAGEQMVRNRAALTETRHDRA